MILRRTHPGKSRRARLGYSKRARAVDSRLIFSIGWPGWQGKMVKVEDGGKLRNSSAVLLLQ